MRGDYTVSKINIDRLILYNNIKIDEVVQTSVKLYNEFFYREDISYMEEDYYKVQSMLLSATESQDIKGSYWQNYICKLIAESENLFSLMGEKGERDENILKLSLREMVELKKLYNLDWESISNTFNDTETSVCCMHTNSNSLNKKLKREKVKYALETSTSQDTIDVLYKYYNRFGCGIFERYNAFIWDKCLVGVENFDKITFDKLVGYEKQKISLIENTEFFLKGYRANNVLLYGDRGTGKSSCIKALLNKFNDDKLRIISLNKNQISSLYKILELIANRGIRFIIFIDDLSFEDAELEYKDFKSVIEGGIEAQPLNTVIYVTSNRRNIIKETWKDRGIDGGDVHQNDGMQERLSLADRFGLSITFSSPDKNTYLEIVKNLAKQENLEIDERELVDEALKWELRQSGRSGRTAKQYINYIQAKKMIRK